MPRSNPRTAKCPQCGRPASLAPENIARPFCSERCRLIDLGAWVEESYRVPGETVIVSDQGGDEADD